MPFIETYYTWDWQGLTWGMFTNKQFHPVTIMWEEKPSLFITVVYSGFHIKFANNL
jgi:hypothetical protein